MHHEKDWNIFVQLFSYQYRRPEWKDLNNLAHDEFHAGTKTDLCQSTLLLKINKYHM